MLLKRFSIIIAIISIFVFGIFLVFLGISQYSSIKNSQSIDEQKRNLANNIPPSSLLPQEEESYPRKKTDASEMNVEAEAAIALDVASNKILFSKNVDNKFAPASLVKLLTAVLVIDNTNFEDIVTISKDILKTEGKSGNLVAGEKISIKNLLYIALNESSNDATMALAEYVGSLPQVSNIIEESLIGNDFKKEDSERITKTPVEKFVSLMNKKAKFLGLENSHFTNPVGLDEPGNYSTAFDLARMTKFVLYYPIVWEILRTQEITVYSQDKKITHNVFNTNKLLGQLPNIEGGKTGFTDNARQSMVLVVGDPIRNHKVIIVVLRSSDRFGETKRLAEWTFASYEWR